jgi:hypothetical protein
MVHSFQHSKLELLFPIGPLGYVRQAMVNGGYSALRASKLELSFPVSPLGCLRQPMGAGGKHTPD